MKQYSIGYNELMSFPYEKYLEFSKIITLEEKEKEKERQKMEKDT
jgi:hypothetical protein